MDNDQLNHLLTYTVFHIGVYISLVTALIGVGVLGKLDHPLLRWAVLCFLVAGICGAAVGSNIPEYGTWKSFSEAKLGFWGGALLGYSAWTTIEHLAFWAGILPLAGGFLVKGAKVFG